MTSTTIYPQTSSAVGFLVYTCTADNVVTYLGTGTMGVYLYGAQAESGAYATSYIPTTTASVTRVADALSILDIVDLPSFTLLLVVAQHEAYPGSASFLSFSASGAEGNVYLNGGYSLQYYSPSTGYLGTAVSTVDGCKLLVRGNGVGTNNITVFKNGLNIAQGSNPNSSLHGIQFSINTLLQLGNLIVFPSALTDAECIALTTP